MSRILAYPDTSISNGLLMYFPFDGNTSSIVNSVPVTATSITYSSLTVNQGAAFNGTNSRVKVGLNAFPTILTAATVAMWAYTPTLQASVLCATDDDILNRFNISLPWVDGNVYWDFGDITNGGRCSISTGFQLSGTIAHFVFTAVQGNKMEIWINGTMVSSTANGSSFSAGTKFLDIGYYISLNGYWRGIVDEMGFWNRALTPTEIATLYNDGNGTQYPPLKRIMTYDVPVPPLSGCVLYLDAANTNSYSGAGSSMWYDLSGQANHCNFGLNKPTFEPATKSLNFNGSSNYGIIPDSASLNFGTGDTTILAFTRILGSQNSGGQTLVEKGARFDFPTPSGYSFMSYDGGKNTYTILSDGVTKHEQLFSPSVSQNPVETFQQLVMRRSGGTVNHYKDAVLTNVFTNHGVNISTNRVMNIGFSPVYTSYWKGSAYSILIYNRALTDAEIQQAYKFQSRGGQIMNTNPSVMLASGGTIITDGDYKVHVFSATTGGTFQVLENPDNTTVEYLIVGGGGGGGGSNTNTNAGSGGGGAGGLLTGFTAAPVQSYSITVGTGGTAGGTFSVPPGSDGTSSVFGISAIGGGSGGVGIAFAPISGLPGLSGGSGGGSTNAFTGLVAGAGISGQGFSGGTAGFNGEPYGGGGGGGARAAGGVASNIKAGDGGIGFLSSILGTPTYFAGGGGGGDRSGNATSGLGGLGGGGNGSGNGTAALNGVNGLGGGGGAAGLGNTNGGSGGTGVVIIRYKYKNS